MNIERKNIDEVSATITLLIEKGDYYDKVEKTLRNYRQKANIPGFRPGNVPISLVKKMYGKAVLAEEVNKLISDNIYGYIKDNNIRILGEPLQNQTEQKEIDFDNQESFEFVFDIGIAPEFDVELNKKVSVPLYDIQVDDKMLEDTVKSYTGRFASSQQVESVEEEDIIKGDLVELAARGKINEDGIKVEDAVLSPKYIKNDAQKALFVGAEKGAVINFNPKKAFGNEAEIASLLKISKEQAAELKSNFQITVKEISRYKDAELNQELFEKIFRDGSVNTEEEFKQRLRDDIKASLDADSNYKFIIDARDLLLKKLDNVLFPDAFLKRWLLKTDENKDKGEEDIDNQYPKILKDLKWHLIKEKIIEDKGITVDDADVLTMAKKAVKIQLAQYGVSDDALLESFANDMLKKEETAKNMVERVIEEKVFAAIKSSVKIAAKKISFDNFNKLFEEPTSVE